MSPPYSLYFQNLWRNIIYLWSNLHLCKATFRTQVPAILGQDHTWKSVFWNFKFVAPPYLLNPLKDLHWTLVNCAGSKSRSKVSGFNWWFFLFTPLYLKLLKDFHSVKDTHPMAQPCQLKVKVTTGQQYCGGGYSCPLIKTPQCAKN